MSEINEDISALIQVRDNLKKEIGDLNIKLSNVQASLREEDIRRESERKLVELQEKKKEFIEDENVNKRLDLLVSKQYAIEQQEQRLSDREAVLHRREQQVVDLDERRNKLNEERNSFNNYKINVLKELDEAKKTIEESKVIKDEIQSREDNLRAREKALRKKLYDFDMAMGAFIKEKKDWEIAKNSELIPA